MKHPADEDLIQAAVNMMIASTSDALDADESGIDAVLLMITANIYVLDKRMSNKELAETLYRMADTVVAGNHMTRIEDLLKCLK